MQIKTVCDESDAGWWTARGEGNQYLGSGPTQIAAIGAAAERGHDPVQVEIIDGPRPRPAKVGPDKFTG